MATKTISIDLEAYDSLVKARSTPNESFSKVIKRASWKHAPKTAGALLEALRGLPTLDEKTLDRLDRAQREDRPPRNKWK